MASMRFRFCQPCDIHRRRSQPVQPVQQRFWPDPQPLVERLGRDFFRQLPEAPGVYLMHGAADVVLYVGKAKSLRHRLGSYRVANPDRMKRRTLRLLRLVQRIVWEECADEPAAIQREAELLLTLKPRFNRAGVWQGPKRFLAWRAQPAGLELAVMDSLEDGWGGIGPIGAQALHLHRALVRLLWCRFHPDVGLVGMPAGWFHGQHGTRVLIPNRSNSLLDEACERLSQLAASGSDAFSQWLLPAATYEQPIRDEDLEFVTTHLAHRMIVKPPHASDKLAGTSIAAIRLIIMTLPRVPEAERLPERPRGAGRHGQGQCAAGGGATDISINAGEKSQ